MRFSVLLYASPAATAGSNLRALHFCESALSFSHAVVSIFFYRPVRFPFDNLWLELSKRHKIPLFLCSAIAHQQGIRAETLPQPFVLSGLGSFFDSLLNADRVLEFPT